MATAYTSILSVQVHVPLATLSPRCTAQISSPTIPKDAELRRKTHPRHTLTSPGLHPRRPSPGPRCRTHPHPHHLHRSTRIPLPPSTPRSISSVPLTGSSSPAPTPWMPSTIASAPLRTSSPPQRSPPSAPCYRRRPQPHSPQPGPHPPAPPRRRPRPSSPSSHHPQPDPNSPHPRRSRPQRPSRHPPRRRSRPHHRPRVPQPHPAGLHPPPAVPLRQPSQLARRDHPTITSSSTAVNLLSLLGAAGIVLPADNTAGQTILRASIGPITLPDPPQSRPPTPPRIPRSQHPLSRPDPRHKTPPPPRSPPLIRHGVAALTPLLRLLRPAIPSASRLAVLLSAPRPAMILSAPLPAVILSAAKNPRTCRCRTRTRRCLSLCLSFRTLGMAEQGRNLLFSTPVPGSPAKNPHTRHCTFRFCLSPCRSFRSRASASSTSYPLNCKAAPACSPRTAASLLCRSAAHDG